MFSGLMLVDSIYILKDTYQTTQIYMTGILPVVRLAVFTNPN